MIEHATGAPPIEDSERTPHTAVPPKGYLPVEIHAAWAQTYPQEAAVWDPWLLSHWLMDELSPGERPVGARGPFPAWTLAGWTVVFARAAALVRAEQAAIPLFSDADILAGVSPGRFRVARKPWRCETCRGRIRLAERHYEFLGSAEPFSTGTKYHRACVAREWAHPIYRALDAARKTELAA